MSEKKLNILSYPCYAMQTAQCHILTVKHVIGLCVCVFAGCWIKIIRSQVRVHVAGYSQTQTHTDTHHLLHTKNKMIKMHRCCCCYRQCQFGTSLSVTVCMHIQYIFLFMNFVFLAVLCECLGSICVINSSFFLFLYYTTAARFEFLATWLQARERLG